MKSKILVLVVVWTLVTCSVAAAQSRWSGVATVGYFQGIYGDDQDEGGFTASVGAFSRISPVFSIGPTIAYHNLGTETWSWPDHPNPGDTYQHDYGYSMLDADLSFRFRKPTGSIRPYATVGGGVSILIYKSTSTVKDPSGALIQHISYTDSDVRPLIVLGIGVDFPNVLGALGVGIHGGCRGIFHEIDGGFFGDINLTISLGVYLN